MIRSFIVIASLIWNNLLVISQVMLLIEGKAHAYVFPSPGCKKWDTCAPEAVLHAMGGKLTDIHGNLYDYNKDVGMRYI